MASSFLDWAEAARWGEVYARMRRVPHTEPFTIDRLHLLVRHLAHEVHPVIQTLTGIAPQLGPPRVRVVSRRKLVEASVDSMRALADPHAATLTGASKVPALLRRHVWAHNLGAAAGVYASHVLGQHELFIPPAHTSGRTWMVGPNVTALATQVGKQTTDVLAGVLCTQLTNRVQFEGVAWVRPYANAILNAYIREIDGYDKAFMNAMERFNAFFGEAGVDTDGSGFGDPINGVLTPRQVRAIHAGQAFFAAIEGYSALISRLAFYRLGLDSELVQAVLANQTEGHQVILRFTHVIPGMGIKGIDAQTGQAFVRAIYHAGGMGLVNRMWERPDHLLTLRELDTPDHWLQRMGTV